MHNKEITWYIRRLQIMEGVEKSKARKEIRSIKFESL